MKTAKMENTIFSTGISNGVENGKESSDNGGKSDSISFKDIVMKNKEKMETRPRKDLFKENLARIEYENGNLLKPKVLVADLVYDGLCQPWQDAQVIKILGKTIWSP